MQPFPLLTFPQFRAVLESCECRCIRMAEFGEMTEADGAPTPALYALERGEGDGLKYAVIHIWDDAHPVPPEMIRSVCAALDLAPDIFDEKH